VFQPHSVVYSRKKKKKQKPLWRGAFQGVLRRGHGFGKAQRCEFSVVPVNRYGSREMRGRGRDPVCTAPRTGVSREGANREKWPVNPKLGPGLRRWGGHRGVGKNIKNKKRPLWKNHSLGGEGHRGGEQFHRAGFSGGRMNRCRPVLVYGAERALNPISDTSGP